MRIEVDKAAHFGVSCALTLLFYALIGTVGAVVVVVLGTSLKEVWDLFWGQGRADYKDILANLLGILYTVIILSLI